MHNLNNFHEKLASMVWIHPYLIRETNKYPLHPAITHLLMEQGIPVEFLESLVLEYPHIPLTNEAGRIAYTRSPEAGAKDRQTVTRIGRYLNRYWPNIPGHEMELIVSRFADTSDRFHAYSGDEIIDIMVEINRKGGPCSCMTGDWDREYHPYRAYSECEDWTLYIRRNHLGIRGRALVNVPLKRYVRVYGFDEVQGGTRGDDPALRAYLDSLGYRKGAGWKGARLWTMDTSKGYLAPYVDGSCQAGIFRGGYIWPVLDGCLDLTRTEGVAEDAHAGRIQLDNGDWVDEDDAVYVESIDGYLHVDDVVYIEREDRYYPTEDCVYCGDCRTATLSDDSNYIEGDYYCDNCIVMDHTGDAIRKEGAVELHDGEWASAEDPELVELSDGRNALISECVKDENDEYILSEGE